MKKLTHFGLALLLLVSTTGVSISKHYCGDMLRNVSLYSEVDSCGDGMEMPVDCCKDITNHFSVEDDFHFQQTILNLDPPVTLVNFIAYLFVPRFYIEKENENSWLTQKPPSLFEPEIYIRVHSFLI